MNQGNDMDGYIKLNRDFCEWEWFDDPATLKIFIYLLANAQVGPKKWRGISAESGQIITSTLKLSNKCHLSIQSVRTSLKRLRSSGEITSKATNKYTIITIANWSEYAE